MSTENITVGAKPVQITNGSENSLISVINGVAIRFADSDVEPKITGDFTREKITAGPPLKIWIWTDEYPAAEVAVTKW